MFDYMLGPNREIPLYFKKNCRNVRTRKPHKKIKIFSHFEISFSQIPKFNQEKMVAGCLA
jgi:hypothetical protein